MDFDEQLKSAWQSESRDVTASALSAKMWRHRLIQRMRRSLEVMLTFVAVMLFGQALLTHGFEPAHWLLLPFFAVFLPVAWIFVLRTPRRTSRELTESTAVYAHLRLAQLRTNLRDLWLARVTARVLLGYAVVANAYVWWLGDASWRPAALRLLVFAVIAAIACFAISRSRRQAWLREYRSVARLARP